MKEILYSSIKPSDIDRFWGRVEVAEDDQCWEWTGQKTVRGYGQFWFKDGNVRAHRFSYLLKYGFIYSDLICMHVCDNPGCVNPSHLKLGTIRDNTQDMIQKNRDKIRGSKNNCAKLTELEVIEIRNLYLDKSNTVKSIAEKYNFSFGGIKKIVLGEIWRYVDGFEEYTSKSYKRNKPKLDLEKATEIRRLYGEGIYDGVQLSKIYNVGISTIYSIINNISWKDADDIN
jgi:hypothetical protein